VRFAFIAAHQTEFPVGLMCRVLEVSRSGYYAWSVRPESPRAQRRARLTEQIRQAHQQSRQTYGSPRVHRELAAQGVPCCENTVAKLMRQAEIRSKARRRFVVRTTDSRHDQPVAENTLDRQFHVDRPDRVWAADITYVPTDQGWLYLAVVLDLCTRWVIGWATADHLRSELASQALRMALTHRRPAEGVLHHSDRGVQYACEDYRSLVASHGIELSMSRVGNCYDNAVVESFFSTLKRELVHHERYADHREADRSLFEYIEVFYNRRRRHSTLGYRSPAEFEASLN
jgi:transposase InsO family protein